MKKLVVIGLLALASSLVAARPASAQAGFIRWLEKLSGPGPFVGAGLEVYGLCYGLRVADPGETPDPNRKWFWDGNCRRASRDQQRLTVGVQFSKLVGDNGLLYDETVPEDLRDSVGATLFLGSADLGVMRALDVGAGVGFVRFTGMPSAGFTRVALEPLRVTWKPLTMRSRGADSAAMYKREWLQVRLVMTVLPGGFDAEDFGAIPGSYSSGTEVQANMYLIVNVANLLGW
jgi:hypothetical protein